MSRPTVYFAHPISDYGSDRERRCIDALETAGYAVVNPGDEERQRAYDRDVALGGAVMEYFEWLAAECDAIAFLPFYDRKIGAGVAAEVDAFVDAHDGGPVFELVDAYAGWNRERLVMLIPMNSLIERSRVLGVTSTRVRVRHEPHIWSKDQ
jgi:hypothetical protein